jgi:adenine/guanine/hypoxanthine permease
LYVSYIAFRMSPVTSYIESGSGVAVGSKTGLTAVFCGCFFFISIFFAPIIASIPPWASGGALIIVGAMMFKCLEKIKWNNLSHALSAFLTVLIMPLTYSIAYGLIAGICSYIITEGTFLALSYVGVPKPVWDFDLEEEIAALHSNEDEGEKTAAPLDKTVKIGGEGGDAASSESEEKDKSTDAEA